MKRSIAVLTLVLIFSIGVASASDLSSKMQTYEWTKMGIERGYSEFQLGTSIEKMEKEIKEKFAKDSTKNRLQQILREFYLDGAVLGWGSAKLGTSKEELLREVRLQHLY